MKFNKDYKIIKKSGLFDEQYYLSTYPDVRKKGINPLKHFVQYGWKEGRNPSAFFITDSYSDILKAKINPLVYYINGKQKSNPITFKRVIQVSQNYRKKYPGMMIFRRFFSQCIATIQKDGIRGLSSKIVTHVQTCSAALLPDFFLMLDDNPDKTVGLPKDVAVHAHVYYPDLAPEIRSYLTNIPVNFHFYVTTDTQEKAQCIKEIFSGMNNILALDIRIVENIGRDIAPMIVALGSELSQHEVILHIHSKRSPHNILLRGWRRYLLESLLGNTQRVSTILQQFVKSPSLGILFPLVFNPIRPCMNIGDNYNNMVKLANKHGKGKNVIDSIKEDYFPAGSMFWFRGEAIKPFINMQLALQDFDRENGQSDGTLAHAIERMFIYFAEDCGLQAKTYSTYQFDPDSSVSGFDWFRVHINSGLIHNPIIIFDHNHGGGTNVYSNILTNANTVNGTAVLKCTFKDNFWFVEWIESDDSMLFATSNIEELFKTLSQCGSNTIIVNSLYGYPNIDQVAKGIVDLTQSLDASLDYKAHDFYALCSSPHLLNFKNEYCAVPEDHTICSQCLKKNLAWYIKESWADNIDEWRLPFTQLIERATIVNFFDSSAIEIYRKAFDIEDCQMRVIPHMEKYFECTQKINLSDSLHIGTLGTLTIVKGGAVINALCEYIDVQDMQIPITIVGSSMLPLNPKIKVLGSYEVKKLASIIQNNQINVVFMSSIVPETFSYTISEAMAMGLPIVAFDIGAQGNRIKQYELGEVVPLGSSPEVIMSAIQFIFKKAKELRK